MSGEEFRADVVGKISPKVVAESPSSMVTGSIIGGQVRWFVSEGGGASRAYDAAGRPFG